MSAPSSQASADSISDSPELGFDTPSSVSRTLGGEPSLPTTGPECPSTRTFALSENQRGELLLTDVAHQLTSGGGKPGQDSSNGGRDFGVVLGTLADIGYGVGWRIVDSRFFGVPQRRRRVFIVGALADGDTRAAAERAGEILAVGTRCPGHPATGAEARENAAVASISGLGSGGPDDNDGYNGRLVSVHENLSGSVTAEDHARALRRGASNSYQFVAAPLSHGSNPNSNMAGRRREDDENLVTAFSHTQGLDPQASSSAWPFLRKNGGGHGVGIGQAVRRLTPTECERLQALPDGWTDFGPDSRRYAALGDAVTASVSEWIGRRLIAA